MSKIKIKVRVYVFLFCLFTIGFKCYGAINCFSCNNQSIISCISSFFFKRLNYELNYFKLVNNDNFFMNLFYLNYNEKLLRVSFSTDNVFIVDYKFNIDKSEFCVDTTKLKIIIPVDLEENNVFVGELVFEVSVKNCCDSNKLFEFLRSKDDKSIEVVPSSCKFFPRSDYPLGRYGGADSLESDLKDLVDVEENDKFIYTMPNFEANDNPRNIILIQEGIRNNKKISRKFEFIPYDHKKYTYLREIKEEDKQENSFSFSKIFSIFSKKINLHSTSNEETKRLLSNKVKFN